ncbi:metallo-beta-lactamase family protein [Liberibacter crescens BT-1]|uniref:UPF0173 metal-dependent hydrolase B488_09800 n=1 Tax=Liberibacter crescens (strain BT-1) TaxID=1215343 RepID=L0EVI9_LIBCB|nr:metal-dependent hydrolase [Liberibacter crescens]AGA64972.1 metallo-beta-lactamase family protein [Liberibacter crescens BT-1]AMC12991.1 hydrolase [Liberibacter crescens]
MKVVWLGHSAFFVENSKSRILIDPFLSGNPSFSCINKSDVVKDLTHILLTHGHADHVGDTISIAKDTDAVVLANADLASWLKLQGVDKIEMGNTGGTIDFGDFTVTFVNALHSSAHITSDGVSHSLGNANGLVLHFNDEPTLYHMGDTDIFSDMKLIEELHQPVIGLVPIGDRFTMGGGVAALACQRFFNFSKVIPCHYGSFSSIDATPDKFVAAMHGSIEKVELLTPGSILSV